MLITFKTKSYANITMFGDVGLILLKLMDYGVSVPGAILAEDVKKALENLQTGLSKIPGNSEPEKDEGDDQPKVSLHTRALPLIELLQAALADENGVRWE